ncbi:MAG: heme ABC exporter ATP-binding protein CcmA [Pseudomonadota bacterium]
MRLSISDLGCSRSGRRVLNKVNLVAESGEVIALRGANGSGKTTLLRILAGLLPFSTGSVQFGKVDLGRDPDGFAENVAYAGHADAIKLQLTVEENLAFWAAVFDTNNLAAALSAFDLAAIADRPAHACSAGQKRRVGLARLALISSRRLWLLDEPTVSLDTTARGQLHAAIHEHCDNGGSVIVATHIPIDLPNVREKTLTPPSEAFAHHSPLRDPFLEDF